MISIKRELVLDHFYISVAPKIFSNLLKLTSLLKNCSHHHVKSGSDSWEGIYLFSRSGAYFEILNERRSGGLGIAFRSRSQQDVDARLISSEFPSLAWKTGSRTSENGEPWFDWITLADYLEAHGTWFNPWIMHYHPNSRPKVQNDASDVRRFLKLKMTLGRERASEVRDLSVWFPNLPEIGSEALRFVIPGRDDHPFEIQINLTEGNQKFSFQELSLALEDGVEILAQDLGEMRISQTGNVAYLRSETNL